MAQIFLTSEQVAEALQVDVETVRRYLRAGKLRGRKLSPKCWRISEASLRAFIGGEE